MFPKIKRFLAKVLKNELKNEVRDEVRDEIREEMMDDEDFMDKKLRRSETIQKLLPVQKGDMIEFDSGRIYQVMHAKMSGDTRGDMYWYRWVNKPSLMLIETDDRQRKTTYSTCRELNYYLSLEVDNIKKITRMEFAEREKELTLDECHELAFLQEKRREKLQRFIKGFAL